jgi:hypothetical protein
MFTSDTGEETMLDRLMENTEVLDAMLSLPKSTNEQMVESRREELFSIFWEKDLKRKLNR